MSKLVPIIIAILIIVFIYQAFVRGRRNQNGNSPPESQQAEIIAGSLDIPWALAFLPEGQILVTERTGQIIRVDENGQKETVAGINEVNPVGEGGLLGLTLHPDFSQNNYLYVYYTYSGNEDQILNRVVRYTYTNNSLSENKIIVDQIPGNSNHNGGRIKFGPDGFLYITTGDAQESSLAQDTNSLAGKILRVTEEGQPAPDNPFNNQIFTYGFRNPQGLAWINSQLWATDHGSSGQDELNRIDKGNNYGWPVITGDEQREGMQAPVIQSDQETWAPAGLTVQNGILYFAGLRGRGLYVYNPESNQLNKRLDNQFGRLREAILGPDGSLYLTTSNRDGRGNPGENDDLILKVNAAEL
jgi:glucose/arabinose dehydrogenase